MDRDLLIRRYFSMGLKYKDIRHVLETRHDISISLRHLKRLLTSLSLRRREFHDIRQAVDFIHSQLANSGQLHGYRIMCERCKENGINVRVNDVRLILKYLDPVGSALRSARRLRRRQYYAAGPDFIWHLDGYDKLKPFGICISGCMCGFSRKLMWLNAYHTNNDPRVIGGYFLVAVKENEGCPGLVRGDYGTENGHVCAFQNFLRRHTAGDQRPYIDGASTSNQRIECWWGYLRREHLNFWIEMFKHFQDIGDFSGDFLDKNLARFCFMALIQTELDLAVKMWNNHYIRPSVNPRVPHGRPNIMHNMPSLWNTRDYTCPVTDEDMRACIEDATFRSAIPCDDDVYELCISYMKANNLKPPSDATSACNLYMDLRAYTRVLM